MNDNTYFLNALVQGDSVSIQIIYETCLPYVKKFIVQNSGSIEDAEDIFQKALLQVAVRYKKEAFEIKIDFDAYLFGVCKNLWRRELKLKKNRVTNDPVIELVSEDKHQAIALVEQKRHELFVEKLHLISENCKLILTLHFAKVSCAEIAEEHGYSSEIVVRQRVFKCKKQLIDLIKKDHRYSTLIAL